MVRGRGSGVGQSGLCSALLSPTVGPWTHSLLLQASVSSFEKWEQSWHSVSAPETSALSSHPGGP